MELTHVPPTDPPPLTVSRYGPTGASARARVYDWLDHLGIRAERCQYLGTANNKASTLLRRIPDVARAEMSLRRLGAGIRNRTLIMSRGASPLSSGAVEDSLLRQARHSVYDFDDAIFLQRKGLLQQVWSEKRVWQKAVAAADVVVAGSEILAEAASAVRKDVVMIPTCVDPKDYRKKQTYEISRDPRAVWIGTPSTEGFLRTIEDALLTLNRLKGLRLTVISAGQTSLGPLDSMVTRLDWAPDTFQDQLANADFGLMPLPDAPFERGKCAYKLLQYGAAGLPVIGSPVGANVSALTKLGGISASTGKQWVGSVAAILDASQVERAELGAAARDGVERHFSFAAWAATWRAATGL